MLLKSSWGCLAYWRIRWQSCFSVGLHNELTKVLIKLSVNLAILYSKSNFDIDDQWEESSCNTRWRPSRMGMDKDGDLSILHAEIHHRYCGHVSESIRRPQLGTTPISTRVVSSHKKRNSNRQIRLGLTQNQCIVCFFQRPYHAKHTNLLSYHWSWKIDVIVGARPKFQENLYLKDNPNPGGLG